MIQPPHRGTTNSAADGEALFDSVAPRHDGVGVVCAGGEDKALSDLFVRMAVRNIVGVGAIRNERHS